MNRRYRPVRRGGRQLADLLFAAVSRDEKSRNVRSAVLAGGKVAGGEGREQSLQKGKCGRSAYGREHAGQGKRFLRSLSGDDDALHCFRAQQFCNRRVGEKGHVGARAQRIDVSLIGAESLPAVDQVDVFGEVGEVERVLEGGVSAAHDRDFFLRKKAPSHVAQ